jgi:MFS family permease
MPIPEIPMTNKTPAGSAALARQRAWWLVLLAAGGTFALTMGSRQTMGFFLSPLNTATGLGVGSISLAFAFGQLWWGLTQPFAGAVADRIGAGRVLFIGISLVALGTFLTPLMTTTWGLILTIGVLSAGGAGMAGPSVLMAAASRLIPAERRGMATGIVNAGGSFGQFLMAPLAAALTVGLGWVGALQALAFIVLLALPAAWLLGGAGAGAAPVLWHQRWFCQRARPFAGHCAIRVFCCFRRASSSVAFTWRFSPPTCLG